MKTAVTVAPKHPHPRPLPPPTDSKALDIYRATRWVEAKFPNDYTEWSISASGRAVDK